MRDLADRLSTVGDGQGRVFVDLDDIYIAGLGDGLAVEADLDVGAALPGGREGHVAGQVVVALLGGQAIGAGPLRPLYAPVVFRVFAIGVPADAVHVRDGGQPQTAVVIARRKRIRLVVAEEARGCRRAGHHRGSAIGACGRDAHGRAGAHAARGDGDLYVRSDPRVIIEVDVVVRAVRLVAGDGHAARKVDRGLTVFVNAAAVAYGGVALDAAVGHGEFGFISIGDAAADIGLVADNVAACHGERVIVIDAAAVVFGGVALDVAACHGERTSAVADAAAIVFGGVIGNIAAVHGERAGAEDAAALVVQAPALVAIDAAAVHVKGAQVADTTASLVASVAGDAAVPEGEGAIPVDVDAAALRVLRMRDLARSVAAMAVGDGQGRVFADLDGVNITGLGDGLAVEAEVDVVVAFPCGLEFDVARQVVVAVRVDLAEARDARPR